MLIASFIGPKPKLGFLEPWLEASNSEIKQDKVTFNHEVGHGFVYLKCDTPTTFKHVLMQSPFHSDFGSCVFHPWVPAFEVDNPCNLQMPTWITIKQLTLEHLQLAHLVAVEIGEVLGCGPDNDTLKHPRFCVYVNVGKGRVTKVE